MSFRTSALRATFVCLAGVPFAAASPAEEPAVPAFLRKTMGFGDAQIATVDQGQVATRQFPTSDKAEVAAFGAVRVAADKDKYLRQLRDIPTFKRTPSVLEIGRFNQPPTVADVAGLSLEDGDFEAARKCRPGECSLKLARSAIERMQAEIVWDKPDAKAREMCVLGRRDDAPAAGHRDRDSVTAFRALRAQHARW